MPKATNSINACSEYVDTFPKNCNQRDGKKIETINDLDPYSIE